jgi:IclR family transcriptional regulator, pca regulon regulatory protein
VNVLAPAWAPVLSSSRTSYSTERAIAVLGCFSPEQPERSVAEIARQLGMHDSTVHRYVLGLTALAYLRVTSSRTYRLTLAATRLGLSTVSRMSVGERASSALQSLADHTSHTASVLLLDGTQALVDACVPGLRLGHPLAMPAHLTQGSHLPIYCTAAGKVLLAGMPVVDRRELLETIVLARRTRRTITSAARLQRVLEQASRQGLAGEDGEFEESFVSIAAPVLDGIGETVAAVALTASTRAIGIDHMKEELGPHLLTTASGISRWMGYRRKDEAI